MKCIEVEKLLSRNLDGILTSEEKEKLETHLESCLDCQAKRQEYETILETLREEEFPELKPYFWERLQPRLKEKFLPLKLWKRWSIRAIPISLFIVLLLTTAFLIFLPEKKVELSQTEFLLRELNPLQEANTLLEEGDIENKNMMLIFASLEELEEEDSERR